MEGSNSYDTVRALVERHPQRGMAVDLLASAFVPLPLEIAELLDEELVAESPLNLFDIASHGQVVAAFELARRQGVGSSPVVLQSGELGTVTIINAEADYGLVLGLVSDELSEVGAREILEELVPRLLTATSSVTGVYTSIDEAFTRRLGWTPEEVEGKSSLIFAHEDFHEAGIQEWAVMLAKPGSETRQKSRVRAKDGSYVWMEITNRNRLQGPERAVMVELLDVSEEMKARDDLADREQLLASVADALPSGVLHVDGNNEISFANSQWWSITGLAEGSTVVDLLAVVARPDQLIQALADARGNGDERDVEVRIGSDNSAAGQTKFGQLRIRTVGADGGLVLVIDDVTGATLLRRRLQEAAERDSLTGSFNRSGIMTRLEALCGSESPLGDLPLSVLFCDIDGLKQVNDTVGHSAGDALICHVAAGLVASLRTTELVGRLGGDEFLVILENADEAAAQRIADRICTAFTLLAMDNSPVSASVSIGVAEWIRGESPDALLRRADEEMYRIKRQRITESWVSMDLVVDKTQDDVGDSARSSDRRPGALL